MISNRLKVLLKQFDDFFKNMDTGFILDDNFQFHMNSITNPICHKRNNFLQGLTISINPSWAMGVSEDPKEKIVFVQYKSEYSSFRG